MNIKGKRVTLRAMEKCDCPLIVEMFNDPEMENLVVGWSFPLAQFAQERWLEEHYRDQNNLRFIIEDERGQAVGVATLVEIDWKNRCAVHGIKIARQADRGRGIGTDAVMALMRYAFDELQLNRLETTWFATNIPSQSMYLKCGWQKEGVKRRSVYKRGEYRDLVLAGVLAEEYRALVAANHYWG